LFFCLWLAVGLFRAEWRLRRRGREAPLHAVPPEAPPPERRASPPEEPPATRPEAA